MLSFLHYSILIFLYSAWSWILEKIAIGLIQGTVSFSRPRFTFGTIVCAGIFILAHATCLPVYPALLFFISALIITIHTDSSYMLISRYASLYLVPIGCIASYYKALSVTPTESILAALVYAGIFYTINQVFRMIKGHDGMGQGDIELIACIGAWIGFVGAWFTILLGSTLGTISIMLYSLYTSNTPQKIPFGVFLAIGAIFYCILLKQISSYIDLCCAL